jgi:hypothetical protein
MYGKINIGIDRRIEEEAILKNKPNNREKLWQNSFCWNF